MKFETHNGQLYEPEQKPDKAMLKSMSLGSEPKHPIVTGYNRLDLIPVDGIKMPEQQPCYKVGDWVELNVYWNHQGKIKEIFSAGMGEQCGVRIHRTYPTFTVTGLSGEFSYSTIARLLKPSEVVLDFGNGIKGTVEYNTLFVRNNGTKQIDKSWVSVHDGDIIIAKFAIKRLSNRHQVEELLKAQEVENG